MKICPKCQKKYDNSWKACLYCKGQLEDIGTEGLDQQTAEQLRGEVNDVRLTLVQLNKRLDSIDHKLAHLHQKVEPQKIHHAEEGIEVTKPDERVSEITREPKQEAAPAAIKEQPKAQKSLSENFEQILGEKWFNKLGILAVVVGVALLLGYSFRYLGPVGKISIGYAIGFGLILFGNYIEKKKGFSVYGKTMVGGGWALNFFTTFAMHNIPTVRLVESPIVGMFLMLGISVAAIAHIYKYRSQIATAFSYLLIFVTLMVTPMSPYTLIAALIAAVSLVFFMYKLGWHAFGIYGMVMSYITFMSFGKPPANDKEFFMGIILLTLYWTVFVVASLIMKKGHAEGDNWLDGPIGFKEANHIVNAGFAFVVAQGMMQEPFLKYLQPLLMLGAGLYLLVTVITYLIRQKSLCMISSTFSVIFATAFLSQRFYGYSATVSYIILAQVVLLAGILLKEAYWRIFSFVFLIIILGKLLLIDAFSVRPAELIGIINTRTFLFGAAFIFYLINHILYSNLKAKNQITPTEERYPSILSYTFPAIYAMGTWLDLPKVLTAPCWVILGAILLQFGVSKKNYHYRLQGYILTIAAFSRLFMSNMVISGGVSVFSYRLLTVVPVLFVLYYCLMLLREDETINKLIEKEKKFPSLFTYMVFAGIMFLVLYEAGKDLVAPLWAVIAVMYLVRGIYTKRPQHLITCSIAAISACIRGIFVNTLQAQYVMGIESNTIYAVLTIGALYTGNIVYTKAKDELVSIEKNTVGKIKTFLSSPRLVFGLAATILLTTLLMVKLKGAMLTAGLGIEGLLLFLFGFGLKERNWRIYGLVILILTLLKTFLIDLRQLGTLYYIMSLIGLGMVLLFVSYIYTKYKDKIKQLI